MDMLVFLDHNYTITEWSKWLPDTSFAEFTCDVCSITFTTCYAYEHHIISAHWNNEDMKFDLHFVFGSAYEKNDEVCSSETAKRRRITEVGPCLNCGQISRGSASFATHIRSCYVKVDGAEPHRDLRCAQCRIIFTKCELFSLHKQSVHRISNEAPRSCGTCGSTFNGEKNFRAHIQQCIFDYLLRRAPEIFRCIFCDKPFGTRAARASHTRQAHTKGRIVECHRCGRRLKSPGGFNSHMKGHASEDALTEKAADVSVTQDALNSGTGSNEADEACSSGTVERRSDLPRIRPLIRPPRPDTRVRKDRRPCGPSRGSRAGCCRNCGRISIGTSALATHFRSCHVKVEEAEPHFDARCCQCRRTFTSDDDLRMHMESVHRLPQEAPRSCGACGTTFNDDEHLTAHIQQCFCDYSNRMAPETFKCIYCNEEFSTKRARFDHMYNAHSKLKIIKCPHCCINIKSLSTYMRHLKSHDALVETSSTNIPVNQVAAISIETSLPPSPPSLLPL